MTYEEALHEISVMVFRNTDNCEMRISKECYRSIVNALEKQIPKKPHEIYEKLNIKWCKCGCYLGELKNEQNYCKNCGQALDWSDCPTEKGR